MRSVSFDNPGHDNDWIDLKLVGVKTNRGAVGARITVTVETTDRGRRAVHRTVGSGGSFGASPLAQHIGLGKSKETVDVDVWWPTSDTRQHFQHVQKNERFEVKEFDPKMTRLQRQAPKPVRSPLATHAP